MLADCVVTCGVAKPNDDPLGICTPTDFATWWFGYLIESIELSFWSVLTGGGVPGIDRRFGLGDISTQTTLVLKGVGMFVGNRGWKVLVVANSEPDIRPLGLDSGHGIDDATLDRSDRCIHATGRVSEKIDIYFWDYPRFWDSDFHHFGERLVF